jgi:hypothetical protein
LVQCPHAENNYAHGMLINNINNADSTGIVQLDTTCDFFPIFGALNSCAKHTGFGFKIWQLFPLCLQASLMTEVFHEVT